MKREIKFRAWNKKGKVMTDWDNPWEPPMIIIMEVHHGYVHQLEYKKIHKYDEVWTGETDE